MSTELRIEIIKDSNGDHVSLDNIPLEAAESLQLFIYSLTELAKTFEDSSNVRLKLENNSIDACLVYDEIRNEVTSEIDDIITNNSDDNHKIKIFKTIQDRIQQNGLEYKVFFKKNNEEREVTELFEGRKFIKRRRSFEREFKVIFINGNLYEAGGKSKANVHLENILEGREYKISCTKPQAKKLNQRLYSNIYLAVLENKRSDNTFKHFYIDNYLTEETYLVFKTLHENLIQTEDIAKYDILYNYIIDLIEGDQDSFNNLFKLLRLYNNYFTDKGIIRTILMTLKPIINAENGLEKPYNDLAETLRNRSKTGKI